MSQSIIYTFALPPSTFIYLLFDYQSNMTQNNIDEETLTVLFEESIRQRGEILSDMARLGDRIHSITNMVIVLIGLFIGAWVYIMQNTASIPDIFNIPALASIFLLISALIVGLCSHFPSTYRIGMSPVALNKLKYEQKNVVTNKLFETHLIHQREIMLNTSAKPLVLSLMLILILGAIIEYVIVLLQYVYNFNEETIWLSTGIALFFVILLIGIESLRNLKVRKIIKEELEEI